MYLEVKNILNFFSWQNFSRVNNRSGFDPPARSQSRKLRYESIASSAARNNSQLMT